jgi:hypothetical protein
MRHLKTTMSYSMTNLPFNSQVFTCVYLLQSLWILVVHHHCPPVTLLNASAHQVSDHPVLLVPSLTSHIDVACVHLCWTLLATWPPHFHFRLSATAIMSFMLVLCLTSAFVTLLLHRACSILHSRAVELESVKMYQLRLRPQSKILTRYSNSTALIARVTIRLILKYRL